MARRAGLSPFAVVTGALALTVALTLVWGLAHVSDRAVVLGRYSVGYTALLLALALMLVVLMAALLRPAARLREWLLNTYLLAFSLAVALAALEAGLRMLDPWGVSMFDELPYHMQGMVTHPKLGYVHPKSVEYRLGAKRVALNSHGLRGPEFPAAKPDGERRILALGDSVTFGWGVDQGEAFPDVLARELSHRAAGTWRVINAGVNGYNTSQQAVYLETAGLAFQPDIVVVTFVDNDVQPAFQPNTTTWRRHPSWPDSLPEALSRLRQLSYSFQLTRLLLTAQAAESVRHERPESSSSVTTHPGWPDASAALARLRDRCAASGARLLVAISSGNEPRLIEAVRSLGIQTITLNEAWMAVPAEERFVSRIDSHPSARVHAEMGRRLLSEIEKRGWLGDIAGLSHARSAAVTHAEGR